MKKQIKIAAKGAQTLPYECLVEFQGNLKDLSTAAYELLRHEIIERGFSFAIHVWQHEGKNYVLDGHQRLRTIKQMVEYEGWGTPELPVVFVEAKSMKEAKQKVLSGASQYGELQKQGLYEFMIDAKINMNELNESVKFPELNLKKFDAEFFDIEIEPEINQAKVSGTVVHECPKCKHKFSSPKESISPRPITKIRKASPVVQAHGRSGLKKGKASGKRAGAARTTRSASATKS